MRWYVTGTDTDVGKTTLAACLASAMRHEGSVFAVKPIASGVVDVNQDAVRLAEAAGHSPESYISFREAVSPHRAARMEGRSVALREVVEWCGTFQADQVLIEGAGGWRVPFAHDPRTPELHWELRDVVHALPGRVLVVAANRIGVLNQVLLTVNAIRAEGFAATVLLNSFGAKDPSVEHNFEDLCSLVSAPVLEVPSLDVGDPSQRLAVGIQLWADLKSAALDAS